MSYIGNQPLYTSYVTDTFSGNGSTISFTLSIAPANAAAILVTIGGILQNPSAYGVVGNTLTFTGTPPTGTNNITVRYLSLPASNVLTAAYRTVTDITAAAGQTTFSSASYTPGFIDVFRNGVRLAAADYTATNGATVVLVNPAVAGDTITTVSFSISSVLNAIPANAGSVSSGYIAGGAVGALALDAGNFNGTGAMTLPTGTTAQRPASPTVGMHRWNTTLGTMEVYIGGVIGWQTIASSTYNIEYLIVAGGGGGGDQRGGGGGAGGLIQGAGFSVSPGTPYSIVIGTGGTGGAPGGNAGTNGNNTTALGFTAIGGGGGGGDTNPPVSTGKNGGSGGGACSYAGAPGGTGTAGQGNSGGIGLSQSGVYGAGGGGGAGGIGGNGTASIGANGGAGLAWSDGIFYAGGGGAGSYNAGSTGGAGGVGGGGNSGSFSGSTVGSPGTANRGGGGGAGTNGAGYAYAGGNGGSGIVIIRYLSASLRGSGGVTSSSGGYQYHTFTGSGTFTA